MYNFSKDPPIQDYDLWSRIAKKFSVGNIQELLVIYLRLEVECRVLKKHSEKLLPNRAWKIFGPFPRGINRIWKVLNWNTYHSCSEVLVKQMEIKNLRAIGMRIEVATKHFWIELNLRYSFLWQTPDTSLEKLSH